MEIVFNKKLLLSIVVVVIVIVLIVIALFGNNNIKLKYELDLSSVDSSVDMLKERSESIECGLVTISLGQEIDITPYLIEEETYISGNDVKKLLSPSRKYELIVIGYPSSYKVYEIRTTVPSVYYKGFTIGDTASSIRKKFSIPRKKDVIYKTSSAEIKMEFVSGVLVVLDIKCI